MELNRAAVVDGDERTDKRRRPRGDRRPSKARITQCKCCPRQPLFTLRARLCEGLGAQIANNAPARVVERRRRCRTSSLPLPSLMNTNARPCRKTALIRGWNKPLATAISARRAFTPGTLPAMSALSAPVSHLLCIAQMLFYPCHVPAP